METVASRLKFFREKNKMSPQAVAQKLNIEPALYLRWENGDCEPDTDSILLLAHLFGTSGNRLLYGADADGVRSMFPKDASPSATPISDWRFLCGVLLMFAGGAGSMLFVIRYMSGDVNTIAELFDIGGVPFIALIALFVTGLIVCIAACVLNAVSGKKRQQRNKKNKSENKDN